jgi:formamidase
MGSIGSMSKPKLGFLVAAVQFPAPVVNSREDIDRQVASIVRTVHATKAGYPGVELIVFPEYSTQGLNTSKWLTDEFLCDIPGPETDAFSKACQEAGVYGVFSIMERNPDPNKNPYNTAIIIDPSGNIILKYRKLFPWNPIEPWYPGDLGMPVCEGPGGSKLSVCICHDGMIPELAREAAYKGCNVYIRISGYSTQVNDQWILTNRSNAWQNLMYTVSVNLAGYDNTFYYFGEGQICNFDGTTLVQGQRNPWEIDGRDLPRTRRQCPPHLGSREQHLQPRPPRLCRKARRRERLRPHLHQGPRSRQVSSALGGRDPDQGRLDLRLSDNGRPLRKRLSISSTETAGDSAPHELRHRTWHRSLRSEKGSPSWCGALLHGSGICLPFFMLFFLMQCTPAGMSWDCLYARLPRSSFSSSSGRPRNTSSWSLWRQMSVRTRSIAERTASSKGVPARTLPSMTEEKMSPVPAK